MASKRADVFLYALIFLNFYASFLIRKPSFQQPDGISLTLYIEDKCRYNESFTYSSLFTYRGVYPNLRVSRKSYISILLLMCGDIKTCPGPETHRILPEAEKLTCLKGTKILHQNVRGLWQIFELITDFFTSFPKIDILALTETHIQDEPRELFSIENYDFVSKNRSKGRGGGVPIYISTRINWKRRLDLEKKELESIWIEIIPCNSSSYLICVLY